MGDRGQTRERERERWLTDWRNNPRKTTARLEALAQGESFARLPFPYLFTPSAHHPPPPDLSIPANQPPPSIQLPICLFITPSICRLLSLPTGDCSRSGRLVHFLTLQIHLLYSSPPPSSPTTEMESQPDNPACSFISLFKNPSADWSGLRKVLCFPRLTKGSVKWSANQLISPADRSEFAGERVPV